MGNLTLDKLCENAVGEYVRSEEFARSVEKQARSCVDRVVKGIFSDPFGGFSEQVEETIKAALPGNLSELMDLTPFNLAVAAHLKSSLSGYFDRRAMGIATRVIDDLTSAPRERMMLSELVQAFLGQSEDEARRDGVRQPYIEVSDHADISGWWSVKLAISKDWLSYTGYELHVSRDGHVYSIRSGVKRGDDDMPAVISPFDKLIFSLYAYRAVLERDHEFDADNIFYGWVR